MKLLQISYEHARSERRTNKKETNKNVKIKDSTKETSHPKLTKNRHTITVFVRPVQREQEEVDSEKIVPLVKAERKKKTV